MVNYAMRQFGVDRATAEQYISNYDGIKIVAASISPVLGTTAANKFSALVKEANIYPSDISFRIDQPEHLATVDEFTQKTGILGGHNANAFYKAVKEYGVKIISERHTAINGIVKVKYQIPTKDRAGNLTGQYKNTVETKTIYDPNIFSDQEMLVLGQRASAKGYKDAMASKNGQASATADGVSFRIYVDKSTGLVRNFHPN